MVVKYTLKTGALISIFLWDDIYEGDIWRKFVEVQSLKPFFKHEIRKTMYKDNTGRVYFMWNRERIYVDSFNFMPVDELINNIDEAIEYDFLATLLKDTDNIGFFVDLAIVDTIVPSMGIGISSGKENRFFCIPEETSRYQKKNWSYKVHVTPYDKSLRPFVQSRDFYLSDLWSLIKSGNIKLVNKNDVISGRYQENHKKESKSFLNNIFKKNKIMIMDL